MTRLVFDLETNNLLPKVSRIHCMAIVNIDTGEEFMYNDELNSGGASISEGLEQLDRADQIIGHNIINYDLQVLEKLKSWTPKAQVRDTLVLSRLIHPDIKNSDFARRQKDEDFPSKMIGSHSLKAWGYRLGTLKGTFKEQHGFDVWSPEMQEYCLQDTNVTTKLYHQFDELKYSPIAIELEHEFAKIMTMQEQRGFAFDVPKASWLYGSLAGEKLDLDT